MLAKRIIPCLDVKDGVVVKGTRFRNHEILGGILELAAKYCEAGADELVFYDITASAENRRVSRGWVEDTARFLDIPFCVAGGIRSVEDAREVLQAGADKVSINSPALERPALITELAKEFGSQCVVVGIDSHQEEDDYFVYQYTGSAERTRSTKRRTLEWAAEVAERGAGEIVLNCMGSDGVGRGYDLVQLQKVRELVSVPLIASGGAGKREHFADVFQICGVDGALAAGVFHRGEIEIRNLKNFLKSNQIEVRV
jgi:imidazole glycerol-phosphate synthase subunit HisF